MTNNTYPRLIADIGGTNARFCIEYAPYKYENIKVLSCRDYQSLADAAAEYLKLSRVENQVKSAAIAMPTPIVDDTILMVNSSWNTFSIRKSRHDMAAIGVKNLIFLNDWQVMALAIPHIPPENLIRIGGSNEPDPSKPKIAIGPGTGLGMATLIKNPLTDDYFSISAEGGRSSFSPTTIEEVSLWRFVHTRHNHVSVERFLSGPGIQLIYESLCHIKHIEIETIPTAAEITSLGISGKDPICKHAVDLFCRMFGTFTSNFAVLINSFGGIYIGGGIIPKILDYFVKSEFRARFEAKGRYRPFLEKMPIFVITHEFPAFLGASYALDTYLNKSYIP